MTGSMDDRDKFLAAIEQLGEETVRARIKAKYWTAQHRAWADLWIKDIEPDVMLKNKKWPRKPER